MNSHEQLQKYISYLNSLYTHVKSYRAPFYAYNIALYSALVTSSWLCKAKIPPSRSTSLQCQRACQRRKSTRKKGLSRHLLWPRSYLLQNSTWFTSYFSFQWPSDCSYDSNEFENFCFCCLFCHSSLST